MLNLFVEKPYRFVPRLRASWPQRLLLWLGLHKRVLRKQQGVVDCECRHLERLRASLDAGHGILLAANHARLADPMVLCHVNRALRAPFYAMASWHLFNQDWLTTRVIRWMGGFSINREGLDRQSVDEAISILQTAERPLMMFPEGMTSRTNDRLMAFLEGPSFIARTAAKRRAKHGGGKVVVHPIAIKYFYQGDIEKTAGDVLADIEQKLTWQVDHQLPLMKRMGKVGVAMLTLKELQYNLEVNPSLGVRQRQDRLIDRLLHPLEMEWIGETQDGVGIAIRVKNLRTKIFPDLSRAKLDEQERARRWTQLEDTYLAQRVDCYPEQYLASNPSVDRILETLEKFEEDLTDNVRIHGDLKAVVEIGEPIEVSARRDRSTKEDSLTILIRERINAMLIELQRESKPYRASSK